MLKSLLCFYRQLVLLYKIFKEGRQIFNRHIPAVGFREESQVCYGSILVKIEIDPHLNTFNGEVKISGIILYIHQDIGPGPESQINIIIVN